MEVAKISELRAVSIENKRGLTRGQQMLYELLVQKAKDGEMLTREDINRCYVEGCRPRESYIDWAYRHRGQTIDGILVQSDNGSWTHHWELQKYRKYYTPEEVWPPAAIQWFKSNLAACIIKGKILAIPVIEDV